MGYSKNPDNKQGVTMRNLARIVEIEALYPVFIKETNPPVAADRIEVAKMRGLAWNVMVLKGEYAVGDSAVFIEPDSQLDGEMEWVKTHASFLKDNGRYIVRDKRMNKFVIRFDLPEETKYIRLVSQGILFKPTVFAGLIDQNTTGLGEPIAERIGVSKYELEEEQMFLKSNGFPPDKAIKTDEPRIQNLWNAISRDFMHKPYNITVKLDGSSITITSAEGKMVVASRNLIVAEDSVFYQTALKMGFDKIVVKYPSLTIQGELCGPKIQTNCLGLTEPTIYVFQVFDYVDRLYYNFENFVQFCQENNILTVEILETSSDFRYTSYNELIAKSAGVYPQSGKMREGIVVRLNEMNIPKGEERGYEAGKYSFKVIDPEFAATH
jgi:RNA ligase (TIGR02306 family)